MSALDSLPVPVMRLDPEGRVAYVNDACLADTGDVLGLSFVDDLVHVDSRGDVEDAMDGPSDDFTCLLLHLRREGFPENRPVRVRRTREPDGGATLVLLPADDASERAQLDLHYSDLRRLRDLEDFVETAPVGLQMLSSEGKVLWANKTEHELLGYEDGEMIGLDFAGVVREDDEELARDIAHIAGGGTIRDKAIKFKTKAGGVRHVRLDSTFKFDAEGNVLHSRCFLRDDTARHVAEARRKAEFSAFGDSRVRQDRFLRKILHEFRTPCSNAIQAVPPEADPDGRVVRQVRRIVDVLDDLRDAELFDSGETVRVVREETSLPRVLVEACDAAFADVDGGAEGRLELRDSPDGEHLFPLRVETDPAIVRRVLRHLIDNALRYSDDVAAVAVEVVASDAGCSVEVRNPGRPLRERSVSRACQRYYDAAADDERFSTAGIGLGLNVSRNLLQCLSSDLEYRRIEPGLNCFGFELRDPACVVLSRAPAASFVPGESRALPAPLPPASWEPVEESDAAAVHVKTEIGRDPSFSGAEEVPTCPLGGEQEARRTHVLVVDDNSICRRVLARTLARYDYTSETACDGTEAVSCLEKDADRFDLVIMDIRMPIMDGLTATRIIREKHPASILPVLGFSAEATAEIAEECAACGMNDFVCKPVTAAVIKGVIEKYAKSS